MPEYPGLEIDHVTAESMEGLLERFGQGGIPAWGRSMTEPRRVEVSEGCLVGG
jgi:hypothetical protein